MYREALVDALELTPIFCRCRMSSQEATSALVGSKKKELVVNSKWEARSADPVYSHLIYSSEVDVMLTAKRGKAWMESKAKEEFRADNDRKFRLRAAAVEPPPVVLGYLGGGALRVQGEGAGCLVSGAWCLVVSAISVLSGLPVLSMLSVLSLLSMLAALARANVLEENSGTYQPLDTCKGGIQFL